MFAAAWAPDVGSLGAVLLGDGVAPVSEVLRLLRQQLLLAGVDLRAVLRALDVAHLRSEPVDAAVEPANLGVDAVDEVSEQVLALATGSRAATLSGAPICITARKRMSTRCSGLDDPDPQSAVGGR